MADPITDLSYQWVANDGITFSWTAPDDVSSQSQYEIYYLDTSVIVAQWVRVGLLNPVPVKSTNSTRHTLMPPSTSYFFSWPSLVALVQAGKLVGFPNDPSGKPMCVACQIQHIDANGRESDPVTTFAFPPPVNQSSAPTHLANNLTLDPFGQATVNDQDSFAEIRDSVAMLLGTSVGQRPMNPTYGVNDMPLKSLNLETLAASVKLWEPRANVILSVVYDQNMNAALSVDLQTDTGV